jgi:colanic acid/amylovoran biosynthesis glycosyltransferase
VTRRAVAAADPPLPVVAHSCTPYLFATGSWIYSQLVNLSRHEAIVLTDRTENLDVFPFREVYAYNEIHPLRQAFFRLKRGWVAGGRESFFESVLKRRGARVIHSHFGYVGWRMLEAKRRLGLPMATSFYGADASRLPRDPLWRSRYERLFAHGELFLAEGEAMRRTLTELGCPRERIVVQHLGVSLDDLPFVVRRPDASGVVRVLVAATFREKKGIPDALRAVEQLRPHHQRLQVTLVGDSMGTAADEEEKRTILDLVGRLEGVVRWVGFQPYPAFRRALLDHHLFLSPSCTSRDGDAEGGAPVTLIEAQATGMPVVSTRHCDIPEIVVDGKAGHLSPERDVKALAANLERLITAPVSVWEAMGAAARAHIEKHYNVRTQVARLEDLYERLTGAVAQIGSTGGTAWISFFAWAIS